MLKKSLIISTIAVALLLSMQVLWLSMMVNQEMQNYESEFKKRIDIAVRKELKHRRARLENTKKPSNFEMQVVRRQDLKDYKPSKYAVSDKDASDPDFMGLSVDHFMQVYEKDHNNPFNITVFSAKLSKDLDSLGMGTSFIVNYSDFNSQKQYYFKSDKICFRKSFKIGTYLTVTKNMHIMIVAYYPLSVYKGKFLSITLFSLILLAIIIYLLVSQMLLLSGQISLSKLKENLTRFLTHELRSPLQSALTGIEMLERASEHNDNEEIKKYSSVTKKKIQYIDGFVERVLEVNKLTNSNIKFQKEVFNLFEVAAGVADEFASVTSKQIKIIIDESCKIEVFGNSKHIYHALSNLTGNAVKYSGISVIIQIKAKREKKYTVISVEDNGIGIPVEDQKKIFDQFYRVEESSHTIRSKGFGLGLNYVKWVTEMHGGKVSVQSTPNIGSNFSMIIKNR